MQSDKQEQNKNGKDLTAHKLGTFAGVFTPSALTILGIILFLRLGYVVGAAGPAKALVIIAMGIWRGHCRLSPYTHQHNISSPFSGDSYVLSFYFCMDRSGLGHQVPVCCHGIAGRSSFFLFCRGSAHVEFRDFYGKLVGTG